MSARLDSAVIDLVARIREGIPEREWLPASHGLLARGKRHLCSAPAKTGKSLAWLVHAVVIVLGGGSVVILDRENGGDENATRLRDILEAKGAKAEQWQLVREHLTYLQWPVLRMTDPDREDYAAWLKQRADLVIFDSSRKFLDHLGLGESSSDDYGAFMDALVDPLFTAGVATLLLDNTGHEERERARGTSSKTDLQDVVLTLEKAEPFDVFTEGAVALKVTHSRLGDSGERWLMKLGGGCPRRVLGRPRFGPAARERPAARGRLDRSAAVRARPGQAGRAARTTTQRWLPPTGP